MQKFGRVAAVRQHGCSGNRPKKWWVLSLAALWLAISPLPAQANAPQTVNPTAVRLVDDSGDLITNVRLAARQVGGYEIRTHGKSGKDGMIPMNLPPGRYYFTGEVSVLQSNPAYRTNLKGRQKMMFYYISPPVEITEKAGEITLTISSVNYIDLADIAGNRGFRIHITQQELGISTDLHAHGDSTWLRLYPPMYKTYDLANPEGVLHLKWPVFVTPGLQLVFSAT